MSHRILQAEERLEATRARRNEARNEVSSLWEELGEVTNRSNRLRERYESVQTSANWHELRINERIADDIRYSWRCSNDNLSDREQEHEAAREDLRNAYEREQYGRSQAGQRHREYDRSPAGSTQHVYGRSQAGQRRYEYDRWRFGHRDRGRNSADPQDFVNKFRNLNMGGREQQRYPRRGSYVQAQAGAQFNQRRGSRAQADAGAHSFHGPGAQSNHRPYAQPRTGAHPFHGPGAQSNHRPYAQPRTGAHPFHGPGVQSDHRPYAQPHTGAHPFYGPGAQSSHRPYAQPRTGAHPFHGPGAQSSQRRGSHGQAHAGAHPFQGPGAERHSERNATDPWVAWDYFNNHMNFNSDGRRPQPSQRRGSDAGTHSFHGPRAESRQRRGSYSHAQSRAEATPEPKPQSRPSVRIPQPPQPASPPSRATIQQWFAKVDTSLANYSTMTAFPALPAWRCSNLGCAAHGSNRALSACACNIKLIFRSMDRASLKKERLRWHPDRFSSCPEKVREKFQKMAEEIFVVVDEIHRNG